MSDLPSPRLAEWMCLGVLHDQPAHGWAVVKALRPDATLGRVWHVSRALTYRSLELLDRRGFIEAVDERPGDGPTRVIYRPTSRGRDEFDCWITSPVTTTRDLRSHLLTKLVLANRLGRASDGMLAAQAAILADHVASLEAAVVDDPTDVVSQWRLEMTRAAARFVDDTTLRPA